MRGNASKFPDKKISTAQAKAQMQMLLCNATDQRIAALTTDSLVASFRVPPKEAEYALVIERQRRARHQGDGQCLT